MIKEGKLTIPRSKGKGRHRSKKQEASPPTATSQQHKPNNVESNAIYGNVDGDDIPVPPVDYPQKDNKKDRKVRIESITSHHSVGYPTPSPIDNAKRKLLECNLGYFVSYYNVIVFWSLEPSFSVRRDSVMPPPPPMDDNFDQFDPDFPLPPPANNDDLPLPDYTMDSECIK